MEKPVKKPAFEQCLQRLEAVVKELEKPELALEASVKLFEEGMALVNDCRQQLEAAEAKVEVLVKRAGQLVPETFKPEAG
ncbi:MAG TPA: exodeoxyribonuclease VII small subunit [Terriglobales bacterium]|nr:exodeoxyribonuclease VII small subunit [Terriglobales bacterium]